MLVRVPTEAKERVLDVVRCRETFQRELLKSRHYPLNFLRRRGFIYREGQDWTERHRQWLHRLVRGRKIAPEDGTVLKEYLALLDNKLASREEQDQRIEAIAFSELYREAVGRLRCFRGIDTHSAMVLLTELGDFRLFERVRQLMVYGGGWCPTSIPQASGNVGDQSPRPGTAGAGTCSSRRLGRIGIRPGSDGP